MKKLGIFLAALLLAACAGEEQQELKQWMRDSAKNLKGRVPALPPVKPYEPFTYAANDLPDPFKPSKIDPDASKQAQSAKKGGLQPDFSRKKEPLEVFPLETLKMVGTMQQDKKMYALVRADANLYRVTVGNYLGSNFGKITRISENEVSINELVQDAGGDWTEKTSSLQLTEQEAAKK
jgi:type IV pilus assembly protein PilP